MTGITKEFDEEELLPADKKCPLCGSRLIVLYSTFYTFDYHEYYASETRIICANADCIHFEVVEGLGVDDE